MTFTNFQNGATSFGIPLGGVPEVFAVPPEPNGRVRLVGANQEYGTVASAVNAAGDGDTIILVGPTTFDESGIETPAGVDNVSIIGMGNVPRSTRWRSNNNAASPHITLRGSGWTIRNVYFAGGTADYCVELLRDATYNSSETRIIDCIFNGGSGHIQSNGGVANVQIRGCRFINARGGTATIPGAIIATSTAQAVPTNWEIIGNRFYNCNDVINCGMSRSMVLHNWFQATGHDGAATRVLCLADVGAGSAGDYNIVAHNFLGVAAAVVYNDDATLKFQDGANSLWADNYATDQVDYGAPA